MRCQYLMIELKWFLSGLSKLMLNSSRLLPIKTMQRPISDFGRFREVVSTAKNVVILTGAGVSAESGIPTFRGAGGLWRKYQAQNLATPQAFRTNPSLVWEFYHHRREVAMSKYPNEAHLVISSYQQRAKALGKSVTIVTQNIDELHQRAGAHNVIELHGSLFKTRCTKCKQVKENHTSPICEALRGRGAPDPNADSCSIPEKDLPRCLTCKGLLRPHIVWFGENLESSVLGAAESALDSCDLCLVIGTSSVVYPAAMFAPQLAARGVPVAEFNVETTPATGDFMFHFEGPCGTTLPAAIGEENCPLL